MRLRVRHTTRFRYSEEIADTAMEMRLRPIDDMRQRLVSYRLTVTPRGPIHGYTDVLGNHVETWNFRAPHREIVVTSEATVETLAVSEASTTAPVLAVAKRYQMTRFDGPVLTNGRVRELAALVRQAGGDPLAGATEAIHRRFTYAPNTTTVHSTVEEITVRGAGVCQDFAHLWIAICRAMGIPARYVSGYVASQPAAGGSIGQASHAWAEGWREGQGWIGYDPTNWSTTTGGRVGDQHIRVAVGRDYRDVPPTRGVYRGLAEESLTVDVRVEALPSAALAGSGANPT